MKTSEKNQKIRVSLDLNREMKEVLDELSDVEGVSQAEILRRAIALFRYAKKGEKKGQSLAMVQDEQIKSILVGF